MYKVRLKKSAYKELQKIQKKEQKLIFDAIKSLEKEPRPHGCKKLVGEEIIYRMRIRDYRVIYNLFDDVLEIEVIRVKHRREVYR